MIPFEMLSAFTRAFLALWALTLCLVNIGSAVLATVKKRYRFTAYALLLFAPVYFMWQVIFDFSLFGSTEKAAEISEKLCALPFVYWLFAFVILTLTAALLLWYNIRYDRKFITPGAIKIYLDKVPCGIGCWHQNGRVLFSNICMNELCVKITGNPLLNGEQFGEAVKDGILTVDGKVWRFARREIVTDGERLFEMIASDITAEYAKTEALEKDKTELSRLNDELWKYYLSIDESVQRQEILQAKMNIHDEMNRLMLKTVAADKNDTGALDDIFSLWEQNALLLCMEADKKADRKQAETVDSLAKALGLQLIRHNTPPETLNEKQKELLLFTAHEAIINAVKHGKANKLEISFNDTPEALICRFTNDGIMPENEVKFEGGLANIAALAKKQNSTVFTEVGEEFTLVLCIKYQPNG